MANEYKCPHCNTVNRVEERSWEEKFNENLPKTIAKAAVIGVVSAFTGGLGGLLIGGALYGKSVIGYFNGTTMTCGSCGKDFKV